MLPELDPDAQLMLAYQKGDSAAFDALFARWAGPLLRYLERIVHDAAIAEELVQDAFLRVHGARDRYVDEYADNWCSCADLLLQYCSDPNTYIVQFGRLCNDPENESRRIFEFLNIREGSSFQPRQTSEIGFSNEEREKILQST